MSQTTVAARPLRAPRRGPSPAPLRVLPERITTSRGGVFATICIVVLLLGLLALLLLNTALAQGSLTLGQLQRESTLLSDTASNLQEQIDRASTSGALAEAATALGMVRSNERGYINLAAGTVTGTAQPATQLQAFPIVTSPTPPPPAPPAPPAAPASASPAAPPAPTAGVPAAPAPAHPATAGATPRKPGNAAGAAPAATLATTPRAASPARVTPTPQTPAASSR
ncbi:MAG TPA: hypothetical protein VFJ94_08415 [Intrasporangium sp.]|uniref:hypothetical protein n=1 Tax=Intrasporangium sp. TaxID=1925024 RepID=UPI002D7A1532|nr:hypothetical protein [Intrasporangium sp.]HET7398533.1 hypothetical protein [Intrasporangium sp.]